MTRPTVNEQLRAMGARHDGLEERWYHPAHRQQWLGETADEYLGWIKGYESGSEHVSKLDPAYQTRAVAWCRDAFGSKITDDNQERAFRFLEEALELVQAVGCLRPDVRQLVSYVFDRPQGDVDQEAGGVMLTMACLCEAIGVDMAVAAESELARVSTPEILARVRRKNAARIAGSALPGQIEGTP